MGDHHHVEEVIVPDNCDVIVDDDGQYEIENEEEVEHIRSHGEDVEHFRVAGDIDVDGDEDLMQSAIHQSGRDEGLVEYIVYENSNMADRHTPNHDTILDEQCYVDDDAQQFVEDVNSMLDVGPTAIS